ncbi:MAG TPA: 1-acyl-sn-glycerol-3-phosphate acyltransferase [Gemmataceae bacterium]|nr:1-acyl-sn-glycerol-3-phosphate acyltransferase [Gemmataceae bacterium]
MQDIVVPKPYQFVPPLPWDALAFPIGWWMPRRVWKSYGVVRPEYRGLDRLDASFAAGHGVIFAPNHCRPSDPEVIGVLCSHIRRPPYMMASWHLFMQGWMQRIMLRMAGVFSIYREGIDREALRAATAFLTEARRPLVVFPEGIVSRSNDRLGHLMDGIAFVARTAAKHRAKLDPPGKVVVHPIALHYYFDGDLRQAVEPVLTTIERRLGWQPQRDLKLVPRVHKLGEGLLASKETEYFGHAQVGTIAERLPRLIDQVLGPLETEYGLSKPEPVTIERVKRLRAAIVPALVTGELSPADKARRWRQLADCYFGQALSCYPIGYLDERPTVGRILETTERYEEDLTDKTTIHRPLRVVIQIGEAIEVSPERKKGGDDPLMAQLRERLTAMLDELATAERVWQE